MAEVLGIVSSVFTIVEVAARTSTMVARIADEARNITRTSGYMFSQISSWDEVLRAVHYSLKKRERQTRSRPLGEDEKQIWATVGKTLERCKETVEEFEEKVAALRFRDDPGCLRKGLIAMNLERRRPGISRLEKHIEASIVSLGVLLPCFQPFEHEERLTVLRAGNAIINRHLSNIVQAIQVGENRLLKLSQWRPPLDAPRIDSHSSLTSLDASMAPTIVENAVGADEESDTRTVRECLDVAVSISKKLSVAGSIQGQDLEAISESGVEFAENVQSDALSNRKQDSSQREGQKDHQSDLDDIEREDEDDLIAIMDDLVKEAKRELQKGRARHDRRNQYSNYEVAKNHLLDALELGKKRRRDYFFSIEDEIALRELLAEVYTKLSKFQEAEREYSELTGTAKEGRVSIATYGSLCCSFAEMCQARYSLDETRHREILETWHRYALRSLNIAKDLPGQGEWLLKKSAALLVDMYEKQGRLSHARTYRERYLARSSASLLEMNAVARSPDAISISSSSKSPRSWTSTSTSPSATGSGKDEDWIQDVKTAEDVKTLSKDKMLELTGTISRRDSRLSQPRASSSSHTSSFGKEEPALHYASREGDLKIAQALVEKLKRDVDEKDPNRATPLLVASRRKANPVLPYLLEKGANLLEKDNNEWTVLHHSIFGSGEDPGVLQLLIQKGAAVDAANRDNETPLHFAAKYGKKSLVGVLIEHNATLNAPNIDNKTPMWLAAKNGHEETVELLLVKNAYFDETYLAGTTQGVRFILQEEMDRRRAGLKPSKRPFWKRRSKTKSGG